MRIFAKSIIIFTLICTVGANFIANDKPLALWHKDSLYFPIFFTYTMADFGESSTVLANYVKVQGIKISPPIPYDPYSIDLSLQSPSAKHWLGTNAAGQDVATIIIYGIQNLVFMGGVSFMLSIGLAFIFGMIQGYYGGWIDIIMQRIYEIFISVPSIYVLMFISQVIELNAWNFTLLFAAINWVTLVPLIRLRTMVLKEAEFIKALKNFPITDRHILYKHIFPQIFIYIKGIMPLMFIAFILSFVGLEFLGGAFNLMLSITSLGGLLCEGQQYLSYPWLLLAPSIILFIILFALVSIVGFYDQHTKYHY